MMGRQATKRELFVSISLEDYVPEDHLLRAVDRYLDLSEFRQSLAESYSHTCLLYTSPSPRDRQKSRMPSSA